MLSAKGTYDLQFALKWSFNLETEVLSLDRGQLGELGIDMSKMQQGNGLVQDLWENVDTNFELLGLAEFNVFLAKGSVVGLEEKDLSKNLVGERARHDE